MDSTQQWVEFYENLGCSRDEALQKSEVQVKQEREDARARAEREDARAREEREDARAREERRTALEMKKLEIQLANTTMKQSDNCPAIQTKGTTSDNKFIELLEEIKQNHFSGIDFFLNGEVLDETLLYDSSIFKDVSISQDDEIGKTLGCFSKDPQTSADLRCILTGRSESEAQRLLDGVLANATNTSGGGGCISCFLHPKKMKHLGGEFVSGIYPLSARPDLKFDDPVASFCLEIKTTPEVKNESIDNITSHDFAVVKQAVQRVTTAASVAAYLKKSVAFAATGRSAWLVVYQRCFLPHSQRVNILRISHAHVFSLWHELVRVSNECLNWWLTEDGPHILYALHSLGASPEWTGVQLGGESSSRVYKVLLPQLYDYGTDNKKTPGVNPASPAFCFKVVVCDDKYAVESEALAAVKNQYGPQHYTLGNLLVPSEQCEYKHWQKWNMPNAFPDSSFVIASSEVTRNRTIKFYGGGVIFMRVGESVAVLSKDWVDGVNLCLQCTHAAGYVHCDIRSANVLKFGDSIQLIDYDHCRKLAVDEPCPPPISWNGGQWRGVGTRLARLLADKSEDMVLCWSPADDYEMAMVSMLSLSS